MAHVHVVGTGLAGLACAVALVRGGRRVTLYEAAAQAGGRCRSYFDATLGRVIDNGNHLVLSANHAALGYLDEIGAGGTLAGPGRAMIPFMDLASGARWQVRPNRGPLPWWVLAPSRRVPGTKFLHYLAAARLGLARRDETVLDRLDAGSPLYTRLVEPLAVAVLNTAPGEASATLLRSVLAATFGRGAAACRPLIARAGLSASFVEPALARLADAGAGVRFGHRLRAVKLGRARAEGLDFSAARIALGVRDSVVLAVPPAVAASLIPDLTVPRESRAVVNVHFLVTPAPAPLGDAPFVGLIGGTAQWLFLRGDVASVTVSAADALAERSNDEIADRLWADTARALGFAGAPRPPTRVIKERRATFAQTPAEVARRPRAQTAWENLWLAGDWTDTGLPATIEGAVRSGQRAARLAAECSDRAGTSCG
jgi:squalene-associated FAD-dependent desaturase